MIRLLPLVALLALAACGVDGAPTAPTSQPAASPTGVTISGSGRFGVVTTL